MQIEQRNKAMQEKNSKTNESRQSHLSMRFKVGGLGIRTGRWNKSSTLVGILSSALPGHEVLLPHWQELLGLPTSLLFDSSCTMVPTSPSHQVPPVLMHR